MKSFQYIITDEVGIHARPAGLLVRAAKEVASNVTITCNGKSADVKKLMMLMSLGVKQGAEVTVTVEGEDEDSACVALEQFFKENL
jgi:phosphocarrier protein